MLSGDEDEIRCAIHQEPAHVPLQRHTHTNRETEKRERGKACAARTVTLVCLILSPIPVSALELIFNSINSQYV